MNTEKKMPGRLKHFLSILKNQAGGNLFFSLSAVFLFAIASYLHFWKLGEIPDGFGIDECSIGYNAWSIAETGRDEYGKKMPLFFRGLDNYHDPVMVYSIVPLIKFFGLSKETVRLPSAIFHIAASVLFAFLAFRYVRNRYIALSGAFIFSVLPWVFPVSRIMFAGYTAMLAGIIVGWIFLMKALGKRSCAAAVISASGWAFAMYSHNCGRPFTAVFLTLLFIVFSGLLLRRKKILLCFAVSFFIFMLPMCLAVLRDPATMTMRFSSISVWNDAAPAYVIAGRIALRYIEYFSPQFLFMTGDANLRHNTGGGELYLFLMPFLIAGFYVLFRHMKKNPLYRIVLVGILVFPVAAMLTIDHMHSTRAIDGVPFWCMTALIGMRWMWLKKRSFKIILVIFSLIALYEIPSYFRYYFNEYPVISRNYFDAPLMESIQYAFSKMKTGETLYISPLTFRHGVNERFKPYYYIYFLYAGKVHPSAYQVKDFPSGYIKIRKTAEFPSSGIYMRKSHLPFAKDGVFLNFPNPEAPPGPLLQKIHIIDDKFYELYKVGDK